MADLSAGDRAPAFSLKDQDGVVRKLSDYKGRHVVLYWYPKDDTPGCTRESCGFRDRSADLDALGASVLGVSILDVASKARFAAKHGLNFPLLADDDHAVAEKYGVWKEKSMYGKKYWGISRETFLVGPDGRILRRWEKAPGTEKHADEVLEALREALGR